jgi:hypothetical protein
MPAITLAAKHLGENIKNPALTNLAFTGASHISGITKSGIVKFCQLHWQQNILVKITKIRHSQEWQNTLHENTTNPASHIARITKSSIHKGKSLCLNS